MSDPSLTLVVAGLSSLLAGGASLFVALLAFNLRSGLHRISELEKADADKSQRIVKLETSHQYIARDLNELRDPRPRLGSHHPAE